MPWVVAHLLWLRQEGQKEDPWREWSQFCSMTSLFDTLLSNNIQQPPPCGLPFILPPPCYVTGSGSAFSPPKASIFQIRATTPSGKGMPLDLWHTSWALHSHNWPAHHRDTTVGFVVCSKLPRIFLAPPDGPLCSTSKDGWEGYACEEAGMVASEDGGAAGHSDMADAWLAHWYIWKDFWFVCCITNCL